MKNNIPNNNPHVYPIKDLRLHLQHQLLHGTLKTIEDVILWRNALTINFPKHIMAQNLT